MGSDAGGTMPRETQLKSPTFKFVRGSFESRKAELLEMSHEEVVRISESLRAKLQTTDYDGVMKIRETLNATIVAFNSQQSSREGLALIQDRLTEALATRADLEHEVGRFGSGLDIENEVGEDNPLVKLVMLEALIDPQIQILVNRKAEELINAHRKLVNAVTRVYGNAKLKEKLRAQIGVWECMELSLFQGANDDAQFSEAEMVQIVNQGRVEGQREMTTLKEDVARLQQLALDDVMETASLMEAFGEK